MAAVAAAAVAAVDAEAAAPEARDGANAGEVNGSHSGAVPVSASHKLAEQTLKFRRIYSSKARDIEPEHSGRGSFPADTGVAPFSGPAASAPPAAAAATGAAGADAPKPAKSYSRAYSTKTFQKKAGNFEKKALDRFSHKVWCVLCTWPRGRPEHHLQAISWPAHDQSQSVTVKEPAQALLQVFTGPALV